MASEDAIAVEALAEPPAPSDAPSRGRVWGVRLIVVLASLLLFVSIFAIWAERILLDNDEWTDVSAQLLENDQIRAVLGPYLADQVFASVDVQARLEQTLPSSLQGLAAPLAGALYQLASQNADELLGRPRVQAAWRTANQVAHAQFVKLVEDEGEFVSTTGGTVSLDLRAVVQAVAERTGVGGRLAAAIPEGGGQIVILESDQLAAVQTLVRVLDVVGTWLWVIALALFVAAGVLAKGFRRRVLRWTAYGFLAVSLLLLLLLRLGGDKLIEAIITNPDARPAGKAAWGIMVASLRDTGRTVLGVGLIALLAAWLAGPGRRALAVRRWLAPWMRDRPELVWVAFALVVLVVLVWSPTRATGSLVSALVLIAFAALGLEALRRLVVSEHPDATLGEDWSARGSAAALASSTVAKVRGSGGSAQEEGADRLAQLERLGALRASGALTEDEFAREKAALLASGPAPAT